MLAVTAGALAVLSAAGAVVGAIVAASERDLGRILLALVTGLLVATFWRWICLGAWYRAEGRIETTPVGPWGVVGRVLTVLVLGGLVVAVVWAAVATQEDEDRAARTRDQAEQAAERSNLTLTDVQRVVAARRDVTAPERGIPELEALLDVPDAEIVDAVVEGDQGSILVMPDGQLSRCVVVTVDGAGVIDARVTSTCGSALPAD